MAHRFLSVGKREGRAGVGRASQRAAATGVRRPGVLRCGPPPAPGAVSVAGGGAIPRSRDAWPAVSVDGTGGYSQATETTRTPNLSCGVLLAKAGGPGFSTPVLSNRDRKQGPKMTTDRKLLQPVLVLVSAFAAATAWPSRPPRRRRRSAASRRRELQQRPAAQDRDAERSRRRRRAARRDRRPAALRERRSRSPRVGPRARRHRDAGAA